ncbi:MAG: hypothetical protein RLN99_02300, partial [Kiloniellaceae bacterium]
MSATYCLSLSLPAAAVDAFEAIFEPLDGAIVTGGRDTQGLVPWQLYLAEPPAAEEIERLLAIACEVADIATPPAYSL